MFNPGDEVQINFNKSGHFNYKGFTDGKIYKVVKMGSIRGQELILYVINDNGLLDWHYVKLFTLVKQAKRKKFHK